MYNSHNLSKISQKRRKKYCCLSFFFQVIKIMTWGCFRNKKWQELKTKIGKGRRRLIFLADVWLSVRLTIFFKKGKKSVRKIRGRKVCRTLNIRKELLQYISNGFFWTSLNRNKLWSTFWTYMSVFHQL